MAVLQPDPSLLCKLASIAVHADEFLSDDGHPLDRDALLSLINDQEVSDWLNQMAAAALAPKKRRPSPKPQQSEEKR